MILTPPLPRLLPPDACVAEADGVVSQRIPESDGEFGPVVRKKGWKRRRTATKEAAGLTSRSLNQFVLITPSLDSKWCVSPLPPPPVLSLPPPGQVGDPCQRSLDCSEGLCCARHFWTRICKPVLREGQVCTRHRRRGGHGLELFQRCPCDRGLSCQKSQEPGAAPSSESESTGARPSSPSRHSSPHTSLLSSTAGSLAAAAKTRLHVCQKD